MKVDHRVLDNQVLYRKAYRTWGIGAQMDMVIEEGAELTQAISKAKRKGILKVKENLVEELVDMEIMIEQLKLILDDHVHEFPPLYKNFRDEKLKRLEFRLHVAKEGEVQ